MIPSFKYLRNYLADRPFMQPSYKDPWPVSIRFHEMNEDQLVVFCDEEPAEELYGPESDPHEIHNPAYAEALEQHRNMLADWIAETGDKGQQPEFDIGLLIVLKGWVERCVHPEYDKVRHLLAENDADPQS